MACYRENDCVGCETCMNCGRNRNYYIWECDECGYTSEDRKECQDLNKIRKQNLRGKKAGLSAIDMCMIRECAKKQAEKMENSATDNAFLYMLAIPLNVLVNDYWSKSAKKRAPKFINDVMSLYEAVQDGTVSKEELSDLLKDMAGIDVNEELKKRGVKGETTSTM